MNQLEKLREFLENATDDQIESVIPEVALRLPREKVTTIAFIFWLAYMAEYDLDLALTRAWKVAKSLTIQNGDVVEYIKTNYGIKLEKIDDEDENYDPTEVTFGDRIKIYEELLGKNERTKFLYKIKKLRNDISHLRINGLKYGGKDLAFAETKKKLIMDYFISVQNNNFNESKIWQELSDQQKEEIERKFELWDKSREK